MVIWKKKDILKAMQKFLGLLAFAIRVLSIGRKFSRHFYLAISGFKSPTSHIRITTELREDLLVWAQFLDKFSEEAIFQEEFVSDDDFCLFTDAAGSVGFASIWKTHWCTSLWHHSWRTRGYLKNVVLLELFPILVALEICGELLRNKRIFF